MTNDEKRDRRSLSCFPFPRMIIHTKMRQKSPCGAKNRQNTLYDKTCKDCGNSYDWQSKALDGHLILCRCQLDTKTEHGKWCKFLKDHACKQFIQRKDDGKTE